MRKGRSRRDLTKERFWRGMLDEQASSGQSVRVFCRQRRLTEATFYFWRRELKLRDREHAVTSAGEPNQSEVREQVARATRRAADTREKSLTSGDAMFVPVVAQPLSETSLATVEMTLPSGSVLRWLAGDVSTVAEMIATLEVRLC